MIKIKKGMINFINKAFQIIQFQNNIFRFEINII
jgi:hypothetical protein